MAKKVEELIPNSESAGPTGPVWFQRGQSHVSKGEWHAALQCFLEATRADPGHAQAHAFAGNVFRQLNQMDDAMAAYDRALAIRADYAEVYYNRGLVLQQMQQTEAALASFESAISINPSFAVVYVKCGLLQQRLGHFTAAKASYQQAIALKSDFFEAHINLGMMQIEESNCDEALANFNAAILLAPDHAESHAGKGLALMGLDQREASVESLETAARLSPNSAQITGNLAQALARAGLAEAARAHHDKAAALDPLNATIHFNRGNFLSDLKEWSAAIDSYQAAIAVTPSRGDTYCNLGLAQQEAGQVDRALASYSLAIKHAPQLSVTYNNRGNLFRSQKLFKAARLDYLRAILLDPRSAEAHYNLGQLALLEGDFLAGWPEYEWRGLIEEARVFGSGEPSHPTWSGQEPLRGKRILLRAEQGLGDSIQFCRYVPMVAGLGASVVLELQPALINLMMSLDSIQQLIAVGSAIPDVDYQCSLLSLPSAFKTTIDTIPRSVPYLHADPARVSRWREFFEGRTRPRIGLAWSGNPLNRNDRSRSVPLAYWLPYLTDQYDYVCLQKFVSDGDRKLMQSDGRFINLESRNGDFTDTAALIETLDLVISVDTSLAHLSGALGKTTWILLPFLPDWRWMVDRIDSPWYPTATLYRQPEANDWRAVLMAIHARLASFAPIG